MTATEFWQERQRGDGRTIDRFDSFNSWTLAMVTLVFAFAEAYSDQKMQAQNAPSAKECPYCRYGDTEGCGCPCHLGMRR